MGKWWEETVVYQIYPRSFQDSNGDGIGDLKGITKRLDYLKWLGIGAVWICPVYDSPNIDMGYDIRDYEKIMEEFGTMEDFLELLEGLHSRGMRLIMDLVVNHTSDEHTWFVEARKSKENPYRDYYIWKDGAKEIPPNNWSSFFTPSAWSYESDTKQWYLHLFSQHQPDLNWENPKMREDVYRMMNRWLDLGVDGFRMDVVTLYAKDQNFPDSKENANFDGYSFGGAYFTAQPKLHDYLREMRVRCFDGRDCMCVGEGTCVSPREAGALTRDGRELDQVFQFDLMDIDGGKDKWEVLPFSLEKMKAIVEAWNQNLNWNTLFWSNHDQPRTVSRFGCVKTEELRVRSAKMLAAAMHLLRGTSYIYQGEEIGMTNVDFREENQLMDVESLNFLKTARENGVRQEAWESVLKKGRDNARTPMQWSDQAWAGFSEKSPWIVVNPNYKTINVRQAYEDPDSILYFYRDLIRLKTSSHALTYGDFHKQLWDHPQIFAYTREDEKERYLILCNMSDAVAEYQMPENFAKGRKILGNVQSSVPERLEAWETQVIWQSR